MDERDWHRIATPLAQSPPPRAHRWIQGFLAINLVVVFGAHMYAAWGLRHRPLQYDENEYLHSSWLIKAGRQLYRDFFEDHPPHLFLLLQAIAPDPPPNGTLRDLDILAWTARSRVVVAGFGSAAVVALMLMAWRATGSMIAPLVAMASLFTSVQLWRRGLADVRAEAISLALFWLGVVLLSWSWDTRRAQALRAGFGIGLAFFAIVMNPKWPVEGAVLGVVYLAYLGRLVRTRPRLLPFAVLPAAALALLAILPMFTVTTFKEYLFFNYTLKAATSDRFAHARWVIEHFRAFPMWRTTDLVFQPRFVLPAAAFVAMALVVPRIRKHWPLARPRLAWLIIVLHLSAWIEVRWIYPYPYLWAQYMVMLGMTTVLLYGMLPAAGAAVIEFLRSAFRRTRVGNLEKLTWIALTTALAIVLSAWAGLVLAGSATAVEARYWAAIVAIVVAWVPVLSAIQLARMDHARVAETMLTITAGAAAVAITVPFLMDTGSMNQRSRAYLLWWKQLQWMQKRARNGGSVWVSPPRHPIAAFDSSYYWYSFQESSASAIEYRMRHPDAPLPPITFRDLPLCAAVRAEPARLQLIEVGSWTYWLDGLCDCVSAGYVQGKLRPSAVPSVFEAGADAGTQVTRAGLIWEERSRWLWPSFCEARPHLEKQAQFDVWLRRWFILTADKIDTRSP